jgi:hypothetical protein
MSTPASRLRDSSEPFGEKLSGNDAADIIAAARSTEDDEVDALLEAAMRRGLRHVRIAVDAVGTQTAIQQQRQMVRISWLLLAATIMSAFAAVASAIAAFAN